MRDRRLLPGDVTRFLPDPRQLEELECVSPGAADRVFEMMQIAIDSRNAVL